MNNKVIVICGPTASGKTSLAVDLSYTFNGEIISADSRQVYIGMDLGTGKDLDEYFKDSNKIPYHLIDIVQPKELYTLYNYQKDCYSALYTIYNNNKTPFICGGTGLYIEAVLKKYEIPNVPENSEFRKKLKKIDKEILVKKLKESSIELYNKTDILSKKRVIRSLEIFEYSKNNQIKYSNENEIDLNPLILVTNWDVEKLKKRITLRLDERLSAGMVDEVKALIDSKIPDERIELFGMEYKAILYYLREKLNYNEMYDYLQQEIFRLAKRQRTWFRGMEKRGLKTHWIHENSFVEAEELVSNFLKG